MTISNAQLGWSDKELEQLLSWWEGNYETIVLENSQPSVWATQVREAGLHSKTAKQIKQKWHKWTFHYKEARKLALKSNWENMSDCSFAGTARLNRKCPSYWRLHSLLSSTIPIRPSSSSESKKKEDSEDLKANPALAVSVNESSSIGYNKIDLPISTQSPVTSLSGSFLFHPLGSSTTRPNSDLSTRKGTKNGSLAGSIEIRENESNSEGHNIENGENGTEKWGAKPVNHWVALVYQADQRRLIEEAKLKYAKSRDEQKIRHELALRKLEMDEAQRKREHELEIMNKKIELELIKLDIIQKAGKKI